MYANYNICIHLNPELFAGRQTGALAEFESKVFDHLQKCLGIAFGVVNGMVRVFRFAQMFEILERVPSQPFIKRPQIHR